jgi:DNA-binding response OmpR family regulator
MAPILLTWEMTMRVLIVEQEKTFQQSLSFFMERNRFEVFTAYSRREGLSLFKAIPFDVVLCGDRLPDGHGLEMLKELMKQNSKFIPVLMTVRGDDRLREEAIDAGIRGYLVKPFDLRQLEEAMGIHP